VAVALAAAPAAFAQPGPAQKYPLPTDELFSPAPVVPPRTAYQPGPPPAGPDLTLPNGSVIPLPPGRPQRFKYTPRYGRRNDYSVETLPDGTQRLVFTGGVIVNTITREGEDIEFACDEGVIWRRGKTENETAEGFETTPETTVEVYFSGNVIVRTKPKSGPLQTLRADQVYYDLQKERAVALTASLEFLPQYSPDPIRMHGREARKLDPQNWEFLGTSFDGSKLPSDPGFRVDAPRATFNQRNVQLRNVFGLRYRDLLTGEPVMGEEKLFTAYNAVPKIAGVPVFYLPRFRTDMNDPLGPFVGISFGQSRMFGRQVYTTWDMFDLLALKPPPGQKWRLDADYLSSRGPAIGSDYSYVIPPNETGLAGPTGMIRLYGIKDQGQDLLGGFRGPEPVHPEFRGRALWRHQQEIIEGLYFQGQAAYVSDKNFVEQFFKQEWDTGPNLETFAYLTYQRRNFAVTGLADDRLNRDWIAQTQWLPRLDAYTTGLTFFDDLFVYSAHGSAGYAEALPSRVNPGPILSTDRADSTGRFDYLQELSVPFSLGPVKLAPYGKLDLAEYTNDLNGDAVGRVWGGGGARASLPLSRLYEGVSSDLFNARGLYHKVVFGANYLYARTNVPYTQLPLLDRLNDDATDQAWRNMTEYQSLFVAGANGLLLQGAGNPNNQFNPQQYLIRRAATNRVDTLDNIDVLQLDMRHRFQTKRGYPGLEHTVDLLTVAASVSYFPEAARDNFGHPFAFLEYDALWNVGDRTAVMASGWFEPYDNGSRYYTVGALLNRPDRTNFYFGYRQTDPLNSRAVTANVAYQLSRRYFIGVGTSYDFGINAALSNTFTLTRTGTDLTVSLGVNYNSLVNNFGVQFMITPNVLQALGNGRFSGTPLGTSGLRGRSR
jgi:hypothetical protein